MLDVSHGLSGKRDGCWFSFIAFKNNLLRFQISLNLPNKLGDYGLTHKQKKVVSPFRDTTLINYNLMKI